MKNYTTLQNNVSKYLNFADTFRFTCLALTAHDTGITDSTFEQIKYLTKDNSIETIHKFIDRLRKSEIIKIETFYESGTKKRNKYYMPKLETTFKMIGKEITDLPNLKPEQKGFLIQLFTLCINNTKRCEFTNDRIAKELKVSPATVSKYTNELIKLGSLVKLKKGYELIGNYFIEGVEAKQKIKLDEITVLNIKSVELKNIYGENFISNIIDNTNWNNVTSPIKYILSIESGIANKPKFQIKNIEQIDLIAI